MSVRVADGEIFLEGYCHVEDAEPLSSHLQGPAKIVDLSDCRGLHTALVQALLTFKPQIRGQIGDPVLDQLLAASLSSPA